jgi:quercetin dioxygenase-like cupin family protein
MTIHKHRGNFTWEKTEILKYKEDGTNFKDITRQILFLGAPELPSELRYFEISPGGHSTLERHEHLHVVMVIRGRGEALIGLQVASLDCFDVITIPALTWHQFQANAGETLGFLCLVASKRDRPERPGAEQLEHLRSDPAVAKFIMV